MAKLTLKVKKIPFKHPQTKKAGFVARVVTNGAEVRTYQRMIIGGLIYK